jgi:hypothetical protein
MVDWEYIHQFVQAHDRKPKMWHPICHTGSEREALESAQMMYPTWPVSSTGLSGYFEIGSSGYCRIELLDRTLNWTYKFARGTSSSDGPPIGYRS